MAVCNTKRVQRAPSISCCSLLCAKERYWPRPLQPASAAAQGENNITCFSLQEKHKLLLGAYPQLLSAIPAEPRHATPASQGGQSPRRSYPVSVNCTSPSLHWSWSSFLSLEAEGSRRRLRAPLRRIQFPERNRIISSIQATRC